MSERVFILGAGPVATTLAAALRIAGVSVVGLWARRASAAKESGERADVPHFTGTWPDEVRLASTLILAVRDDAIAEVAKRLAADGILDSSQVLLHCSGAQAATTAFANLPVRGRGLLHPLRAIADPMSAIPELATTTFGIEGDPVGLGMARKLCDALGASTLVLQARQMSAYHAAATIMSNYLVSLADLATEVLANAGIDDADGAFLHLAQGALDNLHRQGLPHALTGPIRRGDSATVAAHLDTLEQGPIACSQLYRLLALRALGLSHQIGEADELKLTKIAELLSPIADTDR